MVFFDSTNFLTSPLWASYSNKFLQISNSFQTDNSIHHIQPTLFEKNVGREKKGVRNTIIISFIHFQPNTKTASQFSPLPAVYFLLFLHDQTNKEHKVKTQI